MRNKRIALCRIGLQILIFRYGWIANPAKLELFGFNFLFLLSVVWAALHDDRQLPSIVHFEGTGDFKGIRGPESHFVGIPNANRGTFGETGKSLFLHHLVRKHHPAFQGDAHRVGA